MRSTQVIVDAVEKREGWGPSEDDTGLNGELCWASSMVSSTNGELCWAVSTVSKGSFQLPSHSTTHNTPARLIFDLADEPPPHNCSFCSLPLICWKRWSSKGLWIGSNIWWLFFSIADIHFLEFLILQIFVCRNAIFIKPNSSVSLM